MKGAQWDSSEVAVFIPLFHLFLLKFTIGSYYWKENKTNNMGATSKSYSLFNTTYV